MAEIENIHCPICTQPIPSSWQNGLPPALATDERRGVWSSGVSLQRSCKMQFRCKRFFFFEKTQTFFSSFVYLSIYFEQIHSFQMSDSFYLTDLDFPSQNKYYNWPILCTLLPHIALSPKRIRWT